MDFFVDVLVEVEMSALLSDTLTHTIITTLQYENISSPASLCLLLTDNVKLQHLNRDFLGYNKPTDVLSFPTGESMAGIPERYLGDIAISIPAAKKQAQQRQHPLTHECQLLAVHGTLHLLGYDHTNEIEKKEMWDKQEAILGKLGIVVDLSNEV